MPEHWIRLRGGWECPVSGAEGASARVTLPLADFPDGVTHLDLARAFRTPPLEPGRESLWLRLEAVAGLDAVALNGRELVRPAADDPAPALWLPLGDDLPARNRLTLGVDVRRARDGLTALGFWGSVALVVRGPGPAGDEALGGRRGRPLE